MPIPPRLRRVRLGDDGGQSGWFRIGGTSGGTAMGRARRHCQSGTRLAGRSSLTNAVADMYSLSSSDFYDVTSGATGPIAPQRDTIWSPGWEAPGQSRHPAVGRLDLRVGHDHHRGGGVERTRPGGAAPDMAAVAGAVGVASAASAWNGFGRSGFQQFGGGSLFIFAATSNAGPNLKALPWRPLFRTLRPPSRLLRCPKRP